MAERLLNDENIVGVPISSQRSSEEEHLFEYLFLRKEIEDMYKKIEKKKRRIEELVKEDESLRERDARLRKVPRLVEEKRKEREKTEELLSGGEEEKEKKSKEKIAKAIKRKVKEHRSYLRDGYTMTESEIEKEGGESEKQYVYFKDLGDGKSSRHIVKGVPGLKLTSIHDPNLMLE
jgi:D-alanyl-D-alanine carboxypeptidase